MPLSLFAADALTPDGWRRDVRIDVDSRGAIVAVRTGASAEAAERVAGPLIPGMPNLHSHAFQRAIAGRTGSAGADGDSFWTWRAAMYAFLDRVDADAFAAIAAQAYVEMLKAGYTRVAEFHYVHHDPQGKPYADPAELARRIVDAAGATGIALTLLPVFYAHAGFGGAPPTAGQRRFVHSVASYARVIEALASDAAQRRVESRRRAAQPARGDARRARSDRCARAAAARRSTFTPPSRNGKSPIASPGAARGRSPGCSTTRVSMRAGASCTRRT